MSGIANFDLLPTDEIFDLIFNSSPKGSKNSTVITINFEMAGYQSGNVIRNLKSFFMYIIFLALLMIIYYVAKKFQHKFKL